MESAGTGEGRALGEFLEESREEILSEWETALRRATDARGIAAPRLRDHVPELLDRVAAIVRGASAAGAAELGHLPDLHALDRLGAGFDLETTARELSLLRLVVLRKWARLRGDPALDELRHFDAAMDEVLARSIGARERVVVVEAQLAAEAAAHRELERFFRCSPDLLAVVGADGYLKRVNPAYAASLGRPGDELLSRPYLDLVHPDDRAEVSAEIAKLRAGAPAARFTFRMVRNDGQPRWYTFHAAADPGGTFAAVGRDVTDERRRAEFEQQLIGIVSHDLRNPLSVVATATATLLRRRADLDARTLASVARIQSGSERALALIRDLLDFTKARTPGGIPLSPVPMDLHLVARTAAAEVQGDQPDRELRHEATGPGEGVWDPARIGQVVANLVSNAFKYGSPDAPVVLRTRAGEGWARIEVHNRGAPIDRELLPHLFEPLRQGRRTGGVGGVAGVGLGLYIVEHVVRAHGGTIDVVSSAEEGTTFLVQLPRPAPQG